MIRDIPTIDVDPSLMVLKHASIEIPLNKTNVVGSIIIHMIYLIKMSQSGFTSQISGEYSLNNYYCFVLLIEELSRLSGCPN